MNKKIVLSLAASMLLATSVFAASNSCGMNKGCKDRSSHSKMMKKGPSFKKHGSIVQMAMKLDLTKDQRAKIRDIVKSSRKNILKQSDAFTDNSFNKQKFLEIAKQKREYRMKKKADIIEKVYALLDNSQKKDLKTMIDMREIMKHSKKNKMTKKGSCNDKNCNGRG